MDVVFVSGAGVWDTYGGILPWRFYGKELHIIDKLDGQQVFIFYTIQSNQVQAIGMFEVLINESLEDNQQLVIDYGELDVPAGDE